MLRQLVGINTGVTPVSYVLQPGAFLAGAFFFCKESPGTPNTMFCNSFIILQIQFSAGVGYIDAD